MIKKIAIGVITSVICLNAGWIDNDTEAINKLAERLSILEKSSNDNNKAVEFIIEDHKSQSQSFQENDLKNKQIQSQFETLKKDLKKLQDTNELLENQVQDLKLKIETDIKVSVDTTPDNSLQDNLAVLPKIEISKNTRIRKVPSYGLSNVSFITRNSITATVIKSENGFFKTRFGWISSKAAKLIEDKIND